MREIGWLGWCKEGRKEGRGKRRGKRREREGRGG